MIARHPRKNYRHMLCTSGQHPLAWGSSVSQRKEWEGENADLDRQALHELAGIHVAQIVVIAATAGAAPPTAGAVLILAIEVC